MILYGYIKYGGHYEKNQNKNLRTILNISKETNGTKLLGYTFELKFDEEDFDDDVIFVLYFRIYWNDEPSDKYYVLSDGLYVSMRPV